MSEPSEAWLQGQQAQADSPLLLALFDAEDRLREANPAFRRAWGLEDESAALTWLDLARQAVAAGLGPQIEAAELPRAQALRARLPQQAFAQDWADGRRIWWVQTRTDAGWLWCVGADISALRPATSPVEWLTAQPQRAQHPNDQAAGRRLLQAALANARAWPLALAVLRPEAPPQSAALAEAALASIRREDVCAEEGGGALLLVLPLAGPAQARAVLTRLLARGAGVAGLTQARWGETAESALARAQALCTLAASKPERLAEDG